MEALTWIGIVLAAGFVGYFGRYAAKRIIQKMEKNRLENPTETTAAPIGPVDKAQIKLRKKQAKQAAKQAKKNPGS